MAFLSLKKIVPAQHSDLMQICGLDEVGRGSWAGPLVACALMFKKNVTIKGLKDSKQLTASRREEVFKILEKYTVFGIGMAEADEIDRLGMIKANNLAFARALENLSMKPAYLLIDGRDKLLFQYPFKTIIKGDEKVKIIACASIMAKVTRDRLMRKLAKIYPKYGFDIHKGYGTKRHQKALKEFGSCLLHRKSFKPLKELNMISGQMM